MNKVMRRRGKQIILFSLNFHKVNFLNSQPENSPIYFSIKFSPEILIPKFYNLRFPHFHIFDRAITFLESMALTSAVPSFFFVTITISLLRRAFLLLHRHCNISLLPWFPPSPSLSQSLSLPPCLPPFMSSLQSLSSVVLSFFSVVDFC